MLTAEGSACAGVQLMVDPDAPSPDNPEFAEFLHWVVDDIPNGANLRSLCTSSSRASTQVEAAPVRMSEVSTRIQLLFHSDKHVALQVKATAAMLKVTDCQHRNCRRVGSRQGHRAVHGPDASRGDPPLHLSAVPQPQGHAARRRRPSGQLPNSC